MSETPTPSPAPSKHSRNRSRRPKQRNNDESSSENSVQPQQPSKRHQQKGEKDSKPSPKFLELNKLTKRFHPTSINSTSITALSTPLHQVLRNSFDRDLYFVFDIKPSDPDFPFDLPNLKFSLFVPANYPFYQNKDKVTRPSIVVLNSDIPRGFSVNIEHGFNEIVSKCVEQKTNKKHKRNRKKKKVKATTDEESEDEEITDEIELVQGTDLTSILLTLEKYLEKFLSREKKETIKIVRYKKQTPTVSLSPSPAPESPLPRKQPTAIQVPDDIAQIRSQEIQKLIQRLENKLNIKRIKSTQFNDIYSVTFPLVNEVATRGLLVDDIAKNKPFYLEKLPCRLHIPTDYLFNESKPAKLEVDKNFMIEVVSKFEDPLKKLEISSKINRLTSNFNDIASMEFLSQNLLVVDSLKYSLTSQMNYFVYNASSLITEKFDFAST